MKSLYFLFLLSVLALTTMSVTTVLGSISEHEQSMQQSNSCSGDSTSGCENETPQKHTEDEELEGNTNEDADNECLQSTDCINFNPQTGEIKDSDSDSNDNDDNDNSNGNDNDDNSNNNDNNDIDPTPDLPKGVMSIVDLEDGTEVRTYKNGTVVTTSQDGNTILTTRPIANGVNVTKFIVNGTNDELIMQGEPVPVCFDTGIPLSTGVCGTADAM
jgi:hypothetical protein